MATSSSSTTDRKRLRSETQQGSCQDVTFRRYDRVLLSPFYPSGNGTGEMRGGESDWFVVCNDASTDEEVLQVAGALTQRNSKVYSIKRSQVIRYEKMETHLSEKRTITSRSALKPPGISPSKSSSSCSRSRRSEEHRLEVGQTLNQWNLQSDGDINQDKLIVDAEKRDLNVVDIWFNKYISECNSDNDNDDEDNLSDSATGSEGQDIYPYPIVSKRNSKIARSTLKL